MDPIPVPQSPLYAAAVALLAAVLDGVTIFGLFPLDGAQKTALMSIFSGAVAVALLLWAMFKHSNDQMVARLRSADPMVRAAEAQRR